MSSAIPPPPPPRGAAPSAGPTPPRRVPRGGGGSPSSRDSSSSPSAVRWSLLDATLNNIAYGNQYDQQHGQSDDPESFEVIMEEGRDPVVMDSQERAATPLPPIVGANSSTPASHGPTSYSDSCTPTRSNTAAYARGEHLQQQQISQDEGSLHDNTSVSAAVAGETNEPPRNSPLLDECENDSYASTAAQVQAQPPLPHHRQQQPVLEMAADDDEGERPSLERTETEDDDDDEDSTLEEELSWRTDPKRSLSDWTIHIQAKGSTDRAVYHVHKSVLAVGPKRSSYFATTFLKANTNTNALSNGSEPDNIPDCLSVAPNLADYIDYRASLTRIELDRLAAEAFPVLLDYMYSTKNDLHVTTENATALHHLAAHLEIRSLRKRVKDFWMKDLTMATICTYYGHARVFKDQKVLAFAEDYCSRHIFEVRETAVVEILTAVDPLFFLRVVSSLDRHQTPGDTQAPLRLSLLVAVYGNIHKNELSPSLFAKLTAATHLPTIEVKAAKVLLELEDDICKNSSTMTSLKDRATKVLSQSWRESCFAKDPETGETVPTFPRLTGDALQHFAMQVINEARRTLDETATELDDLRKFKADRQEGLDQETSLRQQLAAAQMEVDRLKTDGAAAIEKLQTDAATEIGSLQVENEMLIRDHNAQVAALNEEMRTKLEEARTEHKKDKALLEQDVGKLREHKLQLQKELAGFRKDLALQRDMKKLKQVAAEGASSALKSSV